MKNNTEVWIIIHKETGEQFISASGKSSWCGKGHAKNAFNFTNDRKYQGKGTPWDIQTEWEVKEISVSRVIQLEGKVRQLEMRLGILRDN